MKLLRECVRADRRYASDQTEVRRRTSAHARAAAAVGLVGLAAAIVAHASALAPASLLPVLGQIEGTPHILVADGSRLRVFEVTAEGALVAHAALAVPQDADYLAVDGDLLIVQYMPHEVTSNLAIFDVSEPRAPRPVATFEADAFPFPPAGEVAAHDGRLFVTSGGAAYVLDLGPLRGDTTPTPTPTSGHGDPQRVYLPAASRSYP